MSSTGPRPGFKVRALGEIAIRTTRMAEMTAFYRDIIGLEVWSERAGGKIIFFRIADSYRGHTAVLALFDASLHVNSRGWGAPSTLGTTLHHIALTVATEEQDSLMRWYDAHNVDYRVETFDWTGWRGIFASDPDGNTVELVAADITLYDPEA